MHKSQFLLYSDLTYPLRIYAMDRFHKYYARSRDSTCNNDVVMFFFFVILSLLMAASWVVLDQTNNLEAWRLKWSCSNKRGDRWQPSWPLGREKNNQEWKHIPPQLSFISFSCSKVHYSICSQREPAPCCVYCATLQTVASILQTQNPLAVHVFKVHKS